LLSGNSTTILRLKWSTRWPWVAEGTGPGVWLNAVRPEVF
jgi:hypothetical protein